MDKHYDALKLENQLCFPLYAASREVVKKYHDLLTPLDLTYTQYITLMVLWEHRQISVKGLGEKLHLDSGTLTPLLKSLEKKGFVSRQRSQMDERSLIVTITPQGDALREAASEVPKKLAGCVNLSAEEAIELYRLLYKLMEKAE